MLDLAPDLVPPPGAERLLHADAALLVFDKPSGLLSVPAKPPGPADCLEARARALLVRDHVQRKFALDPSHLGIMPMTGQAAGETPGPIEDGVVLCLYYDK